MIISLSFLTCMFQNMLTCLFSFFKIKYKLLLLRFSILKKVFRFFYCDWSSAHMIFSRKLKQILKVVLYVT